MSDSKFKMPIDPHLQTKSVSQLAVLNHALTTTYVEGTATMTAIQAAQLRLQQIRAVRAALKAQGAI